MECFKEKFSAKTASIKLAKTAVLESNTLKLLMVKFQIEDYIKKNDLF